MKVATFDIATRTGVAYGTAGEAPQSFAVDLGKGRSEGARFSKMLRLTDEMLHKFKPDLVAFEAPIGGPKTSHYLVGLAAVFRAQCDLMAFDPVSCHLQAVRKHFLGRHFSTRDFPTLSKQAAKAAIKREVVKRCELLKWDVEGDDDRADACALWDYVVATRCGIQAAPSGGLFHGR